MDVSYYASGDAKSRITVMHSKLEDAEDVERRREPTGKRRWSG